MVTSKVKYVTDKVKAILPALPESPLISKGQDQMLVQQLSEIIKVYGDNIDQDKEFNESVYDLNPCLFLLNISVVKHQVSLSVLSDLTA